jgi:peptide deformylase
MPGFTGIVPRARRVLVEALDRLGQSVRIEATGWYARILQHEIKDSLDGFDHQRRGDCPVPPVCLPLSPLA